MKWPTLDELAALVPLPASYRFDDVGRTHVPEVIAAIQAWYPSASVGIVSAYLREDFYVDRVCIGGNYDRDIWIVRIMCYDEMVGLWSFEREIDSLAIYGRLILLAPEHRGTGLSVQILEGTERIGRAMGAAFIYALATLQHAFAQRALEHAGFRLLGFFPGYDLAEVAPGVVKRVYQSVYAKLLVPEDEVHWPDPKNMTPRTRTLYELLFSRRQADTPTE
jgi:GNAT superfamily N-acetyltransferase